MKPEELRQAIAKDVLSRIVADEDTRVETLAYLVVAGNRNEHCQVCAIGSLVLCSLENRELRREFGVRADVSPEDLEENVMFKEFVDGTLMSAFSAEQLGLIETAFEVSMAGYWGGASLDDGSKPSDVHHEFSPIESLNDASREQYNKLFRAFEFGENADSSPRGRLAAIMRNIVEHGEFKV